MININDTIITEIRNIKIDEIKTKYSSEEDFEIDLSTIDKEDSLIQIPDNILENMFNKKSSKKSNKKKEVEKTKEVKESVKEKEESIEENIKEKSKSIKEKTELIQDKTENKQQVTKLEKEVIDINLIITDENGNKSFNNLAYTNSRKSVKEQLEEGKKHSYSCEYPYKEVKLLTEAEHKLYKLMKENLIYVNGTKQNKISILTKVRLADLVDVDNRITEDKSFFYKVSSKHIDFIIYDETNNKVICGIELFDYMHKESEEVIKSDKFKKELFRTINIPLVCLDKPINSIVSTDLDFINDYIAEYFKPYMKCKKCGSTMCVKRSKQRTNYGHMFYSCNNFPLCDGSIDIN